MATAQGTYTDWWWPAPPLAGPGLRGYSSFEHVLEIEHDPGPDASYFWAHQFALVGGSGGYLGLQTKGGSGAGWGKIAIFSIWDAVAGRGEQSARRFGGEGEGWSCGIRYPWEVGRPYRLRVRNAERSWWVASVADAQTGVEAEIGWIQVPHQWEGLDSWSVMWTEWYGGPLAHCADLPFSSVVFRTPAADGLVAPERTHDHLATGATCDNSLVERLEDGSRHRMGISGR